MGSFFGGASTGTSLVLSTIVPPSEGVAGTAGTGTTAARDNHAHARLTSATSHTLDANGEATVTFTRVFANKPSWTTSYEESANNQPVIIKIKSWTMDGDGNYAGCVAKAYRASILPALSGILLVGPLISALASFNVFGGSAAGVGISFIALQSSN